jgi:hypothetical protein
VSPFPFNFALECTSRRVQANQDDFKLNGTQQLLVYADDVNTGCPGYRYTKIHAYVLVPKSFMKFMFSTVYRATKRDFMHIRTLQCGQLI